MAYQNIATVNIALQNVSLTSQGFGTPIFISTHKYFNDRVRTYSSITEAAVDLPTDSNAYKALLQGFGNSPRPSFIKVGRREGDVTLTVATGATQASMTLSVYEGSNLYTITAEGTGSDEVAVVNSLVANLESNADIDISTNMIVTGASFTITTNGQAEFSIKNLSDELTDSYTPSESAGETLTNIEAVDSDFYFVTADDHTEAFVMDMAAEVEARTKMYFVSTYQASTMTPYIEGSSSDILGLIATNSYNRTKGMYHQLADSDFPELAYVGFNSRATAGSVTWANLAMAQPSTISATTSLLLSPTEKGYLEDRNVAYIEDRGSNILRNGRVASGEAIDVIRGRDNLEYDMTTEYTRLLVSQAGSKIPYNDEGIAQLKSVCTNILDRYVTRGFIEPNYIVSFPTEDQVSATDKSNRTYTQGSWEAELTGAIEIVDAIQGVLSIDL